MGPFGSRKKDTDQGALPPQVPEDVPVRHSVDFDLLVKQLQNANDRSSMDQLWGAVYSLPQWHMIPRGDMPNIRPFIGIVNGRPFLNAFTDADRAHQFSLQQGFEDPNGHIKLMSVPVPGFIETIPSYQRHGVYGVLFNNGPFGFFAPLENLKPMLEYFRNKDSAAPSS